MNAGLPPPELDDTGWQRLDPAGKSSQGLSQFLLGPPTDENQPTGVGIPGHLSRVAEAPYTELAGLSARVGPVEAAERVRRAAVSTATSMSLGPSVVMSNQASQIRAGIHTGECELLDADIGGIAVHIAARILGHASAGDILVDRTVRDLVVGSGTGIEDRGSIELRGVPGTWQLLAVDPHGARAGSAEAELASTPTPGPRTTMRRSDRAMAVMAKRTPWILRAMARLAPATSRS